MKIAIISDMHDHVAILQKSIDLFKHADAVLCCGDLCSPFIVNILAEGFTKDIHIVFGNNDGDTYRITKNAAAYPHVHLYGELFKMEIAGKQVAMNHYPEIAKELAASQHFDVVCYGHDHQFYNGNVGKTLLINPGTLMGYNPITKSFVDVTFGMYDMEKNQFEVIKVQESSSAEM